MTYEVQKGASLGFSFNCSKEGVPLVKQALSAIPTVGVIVKNCPENPRNKVIVGVSTDNNPDSLIESLASLGGEFLRKIVQFEDLAQRQKSLHGITRRVWYIRPGAYLEGRNRQPVEY